MYFVNVLRNLIFNSHFIEFIFKIKKLNKNKKIKNNKTIKYALQFDHHRSLKILYLSKNINFSREGPLSDLIWNLMITFL